jgi:hypothetical protein
MAGDIPGKLREAGVVYACLGTAFVLSMIFFTVNRLGAQQTAQASLVAPAEASQRFSLRIFKETDRIKLKGFLPSEEDHKTVLGLVKAAFPTTDLTDRTKIEEISTKTTLKVGSITFALKALTLMETGMANVDGVSVSFDGEVETASAHNQIREYLGSSLPTGVILKSQNIKAPPKSFSWRAEIKDKQISIKGAAPSKDSKKILQKRVGFLFKGMKLSDKTIVSDGAPENWSKAALHSLTVLQLLKSGYIQIKGQTIRVEGVVDNKEKLIIIDGLASKYPSDFSLESHVSFPLQDDADASSVLAVPQATASER